jgi:hypothetical protein
MYIWNLRMSSTMRSRCRKKTEGALSSALATLLIYLTGRYLSTLDPLGLN